ncbi:MAG: HPr family phosphocarrier protein [Alphaproteobacteria bacterium]|jgi:phosphocarrier protein HPr|nr:HPr family phosphocarrier protein [Alphaproteobacteria bacterium]
MSAGPLSGVVEITNSRGLHARAAARFVRLAETFDADISVGKDGATVPGTSIMGLMMLAAAPGSRVTISTSGDDAQAALDALVALVSEGFGEE